MLDARRNPLIVLAVAAVIAGVVPRTGASLRDIVPPDPAAPATPATPSAIPAAIPAADVRPLTLATAPKAETLTIARMSASTAWPRRAIAAARFERFGCDASRDRLVGMLGDDAWQVRCYVVRSLARRGESAAVGWFAREHDPRVLRTVLRHGYAIAPARLDRGVRALARSERFDDRMLAVELGAASGNDDLAALAREVARTLILRMDRAQAGALSTRLAALTGRTDLHRPHEWQGWLIRTGRSFTLDPCLALPTLASPTPPALLAALEPERFAALASYIDELGTSDIDLAICLDCTASMSGELAAAQSGIDDLVMFVGDVVDALRVGIVAYRDRHDRFKTRGWDFTSDVGRARRQLWSLTAEGGGDSREAVFEALKLAYTQLSWDRERRGVLVLIGDAPPHVGYGTQCADMARRAADAGVVTHVIQADGEEDIPHMREIAEAGAGRCVSLGADDDLVLEIAGLTLGDAFTAEFREFFRVYRALCR